jgi:hypothetical protein
MMRKTSHALPVQKSFGYGDGSRGQRRPLSFALLFAAGAGAPAEIIFRHGPCQTADVVL